MGLVPSSCRLLIMVHKKVGFQGPVLTLGNQEIYATYDQLKKFFQEVGCVYSEARVLPHTSHLLPRIPPYTDFVHARTFFEMLDIKDYLDVDKFDWDKPERLHDLNEPLPVELHNRFNLIFDGGTLEHVFDIRQAMENIIRLCRVSGWIVHLSPSSNFMDHGFYSLSPCFFYDFYRANGFGDFVCYVWQANPRNYFAPCPYFEYTYGMNLDGWIDPHKQILMFFATRKVADLHKVIIPTQGMYDPNSQWRQNRNSTNSIVPQRPTSFLLEPYWNNIRPLLNSVFLLLRGVRQRIYPRYRSLRKI